MHAADTNVLVRLVTRADASQHNAAKAFVAGGVWVSHLVLVEVAWVLQASYEFDSERLSTALEMLLSHKALTVQEADVALAALSLFRKRPTLGFADCLILEVARRAGHLPLGTFDRELGKIEGARRL